MKTPFALCLSGPPSPVGSPTCRWSSSQFFFFFFVAEDQAHLMELALWIERGKLLTAWVMWFECLWRQSYSHSDMSRARFNKLPTVFTDWGTWDGFKLVYSKGVSLLYRGLCGCVSKEIACFSLATPHFWGGFIFREWSHSLALNNCWKKNTSADNHWVVD